MKLLSGSYQVYEDYAEQADNWLSSKEAFLANDDVGVSQFLLSTLQLIAEVKKRLKSKMTMILLLRLYAGFVINFHGYNLAFIMPSKS